VATILSNDALRAIWEQELNDMRQRIQRMRLLFVNTLQEGADRDFSFIIKQNGMFSFSGLTKEQVLRLREEFGVYAVAGRINVAGMTPDNMAPLCEASSIVAVQYFRIKAPAPFFALPDTRHHPAKGVAFSPHSPASTSDRDRG
jgi:aspartate aminotransferase